MQCRPCVPVPIIVNLHFLYSTAISADTTPSPTPAITNKGSRFQKANVRCRTTTPLCLRIPAHSNPAKLAQNVAPTAPMLLPTASAMAAARSVGGGTPGAARSTFARRMVAPIFVPAQLQRAMLRTPMSQMVGWSAPSVARRYQVAKTSIQPRRARPSMRMNWENAKGTGKS